MIFRRPSLLAIAVLSLLVLLAKAGLVEERRAGTNTSTSKSTSLASSTYDDTTTANLSLTSSKTSKVTATAKETAAPALIPTGEARIASSSSSPLTTFCIQFVEQCYRTALQGQTGEVQVTHSCERDGGKYSSSFTYSCTRNGEIVTAKVLRALGWAFLRASTTTLTEDDKTITRVVELVTTMTDITTTRVTSSTAATVTSTSRTQVQELVVQTVPSTVSSTTLISYTKTSTTSVPTTVLTTTTSTSYLSSTVTEVFIATGEIPIYQAIVRLARDEDGLQKRAPSTFCLAFRIACQTACREDSSWDKVDLCEGTQRTSMYTMACICGNGKRKTQHVLEAVAEDRRIVSVTELGRTSTTYTTYRRTTTLETESLSTRLVTLTRLLRETSTLTSTSTTTSAVTTKYTGVSTAVDTVVTTTTAPVTSTSIYRTTVPTTTRLVLAATGLVRAFDTTSGDDLGAVRQRPSYDYVDLGSNVAPSELMAVRSDPTGLYQLALMAQPDIVLVATFIPGTILAPGSTQAGVMRFSPAAICGAAGSNPAPADPTCETFVFSPIALDPSPGATIDTVNLQPFWINPTDSTPVNNTGSWSCIKDEYKTVYMIADKEAFVKAFPFGDEFWITLRFPFTS